MRQIHALCFAVCFLSFLTACHRPDPGTRPSPDLSDGGYFPADRLERNMGQSGVDDVQIPIDSRRQYAAKHGLPPPR